MAVRCMLALGIFCVASAHAVSIAMAQSVCLPAPRLLTIMPMGGQAGSELEVTITGEEIEDASELHFSHLGITATQKIGADGAPEANKYQITIASDCPAGVHEARIMTRRGISSSRAFTVGTLSEVVQVESSTSLATAMELEMNSICNAVLPAKAVNHYSFQAREGQRAIVQCAAQGIDSKLNAVLIVADAEGRDLVVERRGGALDFIAPQDGSYMIKVHDLTYNGGPEYFFRLALQEAVGDGLLARLPSTRTVNSFSWPPMGLPENAPTSEIEPNDGRNEAQKISLPCDIAGSFFPAADVDTFEFTAKKGDVWWVEVASERFGLPTHPSLVVQHVRGEGPAVTLTDVVQLSDIPSPVKPSSNGYSYDGPPYNAGSLDILGKIEIQQDGIHLLQLSDLFGGTRDDPGNVYRLVIREAVPDFALVAWALHMELRNGDRNALSKPIALRGGSTIALEVVALRRDGFEGEIELTMDNLPPGVSASGLKISAGQSQGMMLITAAEDAPRGLASATFEGHAQINGTTVTRPCHLASMAWPVRDAWSEIPSPRLLADVPVAVGGSELAPITIAARESKVWETEVGEPLTIPLVHIRRSEFSGASLGLKTFGAGFATMPPFDLPLTADGSEAVIDLGNLQTPPGDYLIAFYGSAVVRYRDEAAAEPSERDIAEIVVSEPIAIRVKPAEAK